MSSDNVRVLLRQMIADSMPSQMRLGVAKAIDQDKRTCDVELDDDVMLYDVRLAPINTASCFCLPKIDSWVIVGTLENCESLTFIAAMSEIDSVIMNIDSVKFEIKDGDVIINNGQYGGLVKVVELAGKINTIEKDLNTLKTAFKAWVVTPNDGGAKLKAAAAAWTSKSLTLTQQADIENNKIKHG